MGWGGKGKGRGEGRGDGRGGKRRRKGGKAEDGGSGMEEWHEGFISVYDTRQQQAKEKGRKKKRHRLPTLTFPIRPHPRNYACEEDDESHEPLCFPLPTLALALTLERERATCGGKPPSKDVQRHSSPITPMHEGAKCQ